MNSLSHERGKTLDTHMFPGKLDIPTGHIHTYIAFSVNLLFPLDKGGVSKGLEVFINLWSTSCCTC